MHSQFMLADTRAAPVATDSATSLPVNLPTAAGPKYREYTHDLGPKVSVLCLHQNGEALDPRTIVH